MPCLPPPVIHAQLATFDSAQHPRDQTGRFRGGGKPHHDLPAELAGIIGTKMWNEAGAPQLIWINDPNNPRGGWYDANNNTITMNRAPGMNVDLRKTLLHELGHAWSARQHVDFGRYARLRGFPKRASATTIREDYAEFFQSAVDNAWPHTGTHPYGFKVKPGLPTKQQVAKARALHLIPSHTVSPPGHSLAVGGAMPWHVEKQGSEWCVIKDADGTNEGCHSSAGQAQAHMRALYANEPKAVTSMPMSGTIDPEQGSTMTTTAEPVITTEPDADPNHLAYWSGPLTIEDAPTGDRRRVMPDALTNRDLPQPLMFQRTTPDGGPGSNPHAGAEWAGRILMLWRDGDEFYGAGPIYPNDAGRELAMFMADGPVGVSVDMDDADGQIVCLETNEAGDCVKAEQQITKARIMGATACPFPAIPAAQVNLVTAEEYAALTVTYGETLANPSMPPGVEPHPFQNSGDGTCLVCGMGKALHNGTDTVPSGTALIAGGGPMLPPESWFDDPELPSVTPLQITDDGRIYGHAARWGQPHIALAGKTAPRSGSGYAYFKTGSRMASCECPDRGGKVEVATGVITLGTGHPEDGRAPAPVAIGHYDHTGYAVADVNAGEDEHGIWVAGALRPDVSDERIVELRGGALSGDWRWIGGRQELVAALVVNVPGFPIPKTTWHEQDGRVLALTAAGIVAPARFVSFSEHTALESRLGILEARLARQSATIDVLRPLALERLGERFATPGADLTGKERDTLHAKGQAMPDGSYPIRNTDDLDNAIRSIGRAGPKGSTRYNAVKAWIKKRARELNAEGSLPKDWQ